MDGEYILDVENLQLEGSFEQQVLYLLDFVRRTRDEITGLSRLYQDLEDALRQIWPGCKVYAFGSVVTGLAIKTSDADCHIDIPKNLQKNPAKCAMDAKYLLMRYSHVFTDPFAITQAKVPIVKFYHIPTETNCDVSFSSFTGTANSDFIGFMLRQDQRALHLAIIIKYWSKVHNITGTNLLPNYALTLLVMFYLQQVKVLPTVYELQKNTVAPTMLDNWNYAVNRDNFKSENKCPLWTLLGGFFKFYKDYDFKENIISTFLGCSHKRSIFESLPTVPEEYSLYKNNVENKICKPLKTDTNFCIQDSFDHSRNCAVAVHNNLFESIKAHIALAAHIYATCEGQQTYECFLGELFLQKPLHHVLPRRQPQVHFNGRRPRKVFKNKHNHRRNSTMRGNTMRGVGNSTRGVGNSTRGVGKRLMALQRSVS